MFYAGLPELVLPPAPDTLWLRLCRLLLASSGSALFVLIAGLSALWLSHPESYALFLASAAALVPFWIIAASAYLSLRQLHEERYWTAERVAQRCPAIWQLYTACNTSASARLYRAARSRP